LLPKNADILEYTKKSTRTYILSYKNMTCPEKETYGDPEENPWI